MKNPYLSEADFCKEFLHLNIINTFPMNMRFATLACSLGLLLAVGCSSVETSQPTVFTDFVDPTIGTGGHGHVFYGANVPYGFVQLGPTSIPQQWDWCSGYHVSDSTVIGFSHTHLSGTGIGDLFDITVMPVVGEVTYARGEEKDPKSGLWAYSDRSKEMARPGYYRTSLPRYGVDVELTATKRVGFHKYTFPTSDEAAVVFDLVNGGCWDRVTDAYVKVENATTISGYRYSSGWSKDQRIFFRAEFSQPFTGVTFIHDDEQSEDKEIQSKNLFARVKFQTKAEEPIYVKVALSPTSVEGAAENMKAELSGWDFEATKRAADAAWNKELSKVDITTDDVRSKRIFYTNLYHTMIAPAEFCDVNGDYYGADQQMHQSEGFVNYTTFSLWDTYRAAQPLMTLLHPEKMKDIIQTMIHIYQQQGKLPVWHLMGCETDCMVGNPGIPVVADAVLKNVEGIDADKAYEALKNSAMLPERGMQYRIEYGFIPADKHNEAIAYDMEYALADWTVAQVAKKLGKTEDYEYFLKRSHSYRNYFDKSTGFVRGKFTDGKFRTPFNPFNAAHRENDYCEGNAWQYTWLAPHDVDGLVELHGSKEAFITKLDSLFIATGDAGDNASPDMTGLIGQYAHGNEPSHHVLYLYTMVGQPWKTADRVREVLTTLYTDQPDGLAGNEDVGQMSAWYVLSSLGFYQVEPAGGKYVFGTPLFDNVKMQVPGGIFEIRAKENSATNRYIQGVTLNGKPYKRSWISYEDIMKGGSLEFQMGDKQTLWY